MSEPEGIELLRPQTLWQTMDAAPKDRQILLFCPFANSPDGTGGHPDAKPAHAYVVGSWGGWAGADSPSDGWVARILNGVARAVYPSRWAELPEAPNKK